MPSMIEGRALGWGDSFKAPGGRIDFDHDDDGLFERKPAVVRKLPNDGRNSNLVRQSTHVGSLLEEGGKHIPKELDELQKAREISAIPPPPEIVMATRTAMGSVSVTAASQHVTHTLERVGGRDKVTGFGSALGSEYRVIGGEVLLLSGDDIKQTVIKQDLAVRTQRKTSLAKKSKVSLELNQRVEEQIKIFKYVYYELDLKSKPLERVPYRALHFSLAADFGEAEMYASMSEKHQYPSKEEHQWASADGCGLDITPVEEEYLEAKSKKVTVAIRGKQGVLFFRLRAWTYSYLSGIQHILKERLEHRPEEAERRRKEVYAIKTSINSSNTRKHRAAVGLMPSEPAPRLDSSLSPPPTYLEDSRPETVPEAVTKVLSRKPVVHEETLAERIECLCEDGLFSTGGGGGCASARQWELQ